MAAVKVLKFEPLTKRRLTPRYSSWVGLVSMGLIDLAELPPRAAILFELIFRHNATPKLRRINGWFAFQTGYLRKRGIARSTIRLELRRLERLKLIEIQP